MADNPRVQQLLDDLLDSDATPEEVCNSCPELLPAVRKRWEEVRRVRDALGALFPSSDAPISKPQEWSVLPQIPGYEVDAILGRGGMGIVFRARQLRLNRIVALKMALAGEYAVLSSPNSTTHSEGVLRPRIGTPRPSTITSGHSLSTLS